MKRLHPILCASLFAALVGRSAAAPDPSLSTSPTDGIAFTLTRAESFALKNNPVIASSALSAEAVQQNIREVRSALFPQLSAVSDTVGTVKNTRLAAVGGLNNPSIYSRQSDGLVLNQLLTDFGKTFDLVASVKSEAAAAQQRTQVTRALVLLEVDHAYFGVLRAQSLAEVARKTVDQRTLLFKQVNVLMQSQLKSELDASFAEVDLAKARLQLIQAQADIRQSEADLSTAMGFDSPQHFRLTEVNFNDTVPENDHGLMLLALSQRPEISALRDEVAADQKQTAAAKKAYLPTVTAMGAAGVNPIYDSAGLRQTYYAGGINVQLPLLGWRLSGRPCEGNRPADRCHHENGGGSGEYHHPRR